MNDVKKRLEQCFALALFNVPREQIPFSSTDTVAEWDSLATVSILTLIEEEFSIKIPDEDLKNLLSFQQALTYLTGKLGSPGT